MLLVFAGALFVGGFILFPMHLCYFKAILPTLPDINEGFAVLALMIAGVKLFGYFYAVLLETWLPVRWQFRLQVLVMLAGLPIAIGPMAPPLEENTFLIYWKMGLRMGPFFFALSSSIFLLPCWFARVPHTAGRRGFFTPR